MSDFECFRDYWSRVNKYKLLIELFRYRDVQDIREYAVASFDTVWIRLDEDLRQRLVKFALDGKKF